MITDDLAKYEVMARHIENDVAADIIDELIAMVRELRSRPDALRADKSEKALEEVRKQADSFAHSAINARDETRLTQSINRKIQAEVIACRHKCDAQAKVLDEAEKALASVEAWWLSKGMKENDGAPAAVFAVRAALANIRAAKGESDD